MSAAAVSSQGPQPAEGQITYGSIQKNGKQSWSSSRTLEHYISNNPDQDRQWTPNPKYNNVPGADSGVHGGVYQDGYHKIPYESMRAACTPNVFRELFNKFAAISVVNIAFTVVQAVVQEVQATRFGDETKLQSIDALAPYYDIVEDTQGWLTDRGRAYDNVSGFNIYNVNDELRNPRPRTFDEGLLIKSGWMLSDKQAKAMQDEHTYEDIHQANSPPVDLDRLGYRRGALVGWGGGHTFVNAKYMATCDFDTPAIGPHVDTLVPYTNTLFPNQLTNTPWPIQYRVDWLNATDIKYADNAPSYWVRGDRPITRGSAMTRDTLLGIKYTVSGEGILHTNVNMFSTRRVIDPFGGTIPATVSLWDTQIRRRWAPLTGRMIANVYPTFKEADDAAPTKRQKVTDVPTPITPVMDDATKALFDEFVAAQKVVKVYE